MNDDLIEQARTWLAGRYQDFGIYRGKPKLIAKHAQELVAELIEPAAAAGLLHAPTPVDHEPCGDKEPLSDLRCTLPRNHDVHTDKRRPGTVWRLLRECDCPDYGTELADVRAERDRLQARIDTTLRAAQVWEDLGQEQLGTSQQQHEVARMHRSTLRHVSKVIQNELGGAAAGDRSEQ